MKPDTLKQIKKELVKLHNIYEVLIKSWNGPLDHGRGATFPATIIAGQLLQNMALGSSQTYSHVHDSAVKELKAKFEALRLLNEYERRCHMTHFAYSEAEAIITGHEMSEDYD